jgi:hypothetical protein
MPIVGRKPKPEDQRRNQNKHVDWVEVIDRPFEDAPPLKGKWPAKTKRWWQAVSTMPHCILWTDSEWQRAFDTVEMVAAFHQGDLRLATELRAREREMGTTLDARRDLRIRYVEEGVKQERPALVAIKDYRKALEG